MKLIRVKRHDQGVQFAWDLFAVPPQAIRSVAVDNGDGAPPVADVAEFFVVNREPDVEAVVEYLARRNPGKEVQVFSLDAVFELPAAQDIIKKEVTANGILPAFNGRAHAGELRIGQRMDAGGRPVV